MLLAKILCMGQRNKIGQILYSELDYYEARNCYGFPGRRANFWAPPVAFSHAESGWRLARSPRLAQQRVTGRCVRVPPVAFNHAESGWRLARSPGWAQQRVTGHYVRVPSVAFSHAGSGWRLARSPRRVPQRVTGRCVRVLPEDSQGTAGVLPGKQGEPGGVKEGSW